MRWCLAVLSLAMTLLLPQMAMSVRNEDFWAESGILFYDPDDMPCPPGGMLGSLNVNGREVTLVGDSVASTSSTDLVRLIDGIHVTAVSGQTFTQGVQSLEELDLRRVVVFALGSYSPNLTTTDIEAVLEQTGSRQVMFVTNYNVNNPTQFDSNNALFRQFAQENDRVAVADWAGTVLSRDEPGNYVDATDGITPTVGAGSNLFAQTINTALRQFISNAQAGVNMGASGDNAGLALGFLMELGYNHTAAAAIVGNLQAESRNINPLLFEAGVGNSQANAMEGFRAIDANGNKTFVGGFGIVQWTSLGRVQALQNFADQNNLPVTSLELQLRFLAWELENLNRGGHTFGPSGLNAMSLEEATWLINRHFLTPCASFCTVGDTCLNHAGGCHNTVSPSNLSDLNEATTPTAITGFNRRLNFAQEAMGITPMSMQFGGGNCVGGVSVWSGVGFPHFSQNDPLWANIPYGHCGSTIGRGGCGLVSFAMMATALLNREVNPIEIINIPNIHNQFACGQGSYHTVTGVLARHFGLQHKHLGSEYGLGQNTDNNRIIEIINQYLRQGWLIHSTGGGRFGSGAAPYTVHGHFIAIRGVTETGMWLIADSAGNRDQNRLWDPREVIAAGMNKFNLQAVTR